MVLGQILKVGSVLIKHRKAIYAVLTAQDRYISKSFKYGGYGKATSYGVRSGALAGSIIGAFIKDDNTFQPGNGAVLQPKQRNVPKTDKSYKTRNRSTSRYGTRYNKYCKPNKHY